MLQTGKVEGSSPDEVDFFNLPNPSAALWPEIFLGVKMRPARKADTLTTNCEPTV
jgi:hypothetical protein